MSDLKKEDIEHVAKLADLPLSEKEVEEYTKQLGEVVNYISELDEVDTEDVDPTSQTTGLLNRTREDKKNDQRTLLKEDALSQAVEEIDNYFAVSMILKEKDLT